MNKKKKKESAGAPAWVVTFGDMMSLLLCFFVIIVSMSEMKKDEKFRQVVTSLKKAFGYESTIGNMPLNIDSVNSLIQQLQTVIIPPDILHEGDTDVEGIEGRVYKVTDVREGIHIEIGGRITFARFSAVLKPVSVELLGQIADKIRGKNNILKITGHATREPLPQDKLYTDPLDLSYARARAIADELLHQGIRCERIRIVAAGSAAPVQRDDYTEELRARNRRVEIVVTEALIEEYSGQPFDGEHRESPDVSR
ncbi:MAG: flagellar motor protein MotB [Phycisphaerae bacterium]|nr:flagellar motor protein MotB [Phycisphaerae bacterium]